ncbi:S80 family phage morphogenetic serine protease [Paraburkholderia adhaesiva]|uniref:S80 family phage morphogenetic serine protease n=1 Tax=Paraburkholderia adhaesiva TaxID=2883244 RepID=UPI001F35C0A3|nr:S80 family phage morphogenetic serine protease [Paraburkholderia adhaesiva]
MNNYVRFGLTALNGINKSGTLKPDANGYYPVVLGGLNMFNSVNQYYPYEPARGFFENSSQFMRRVHSGNLRGEYGHPKRLPGQNIEDYARRILDIDVNNVSHHIAEVTLDFENYKDPDGRNIIAILGQVKPSGPQGAHLKNSLDNPKENVCFSIRSFTLDVPVGRTVRRELKNVVTWDYVNEPGLFIASKFNSPALEEIDEMMLSKQQLDRAVAVPRHLNARAPNIGLESARLTLDELYQSLGWLTDTATPTWLAW